MIPWLPIPLDLISSTVWEYSVNMGGILHPRLNIESSPIEYRVKWLKGEKMSKKGV